MIYVIYAFPMSAIQQIEICLTSAEGEQGLTAVVPGAWGFPRKMASVMGLHKLHTSEAEEPHGCPAGFERGLPRRLH